MSRRIRRVRRRAHLIAFFGCITFITACGAGSDAGVSPSSAPAGQSLRHGPISISIPAGWSGRVLFTDPQGTDAILQVANFELPSNQGFEPPRELPPGQEDPIKAMSGDDVLIMVETGATTGLERSLPPRITDSWFLASNSTRVPRNHAVAVESGCFVNHCLRITADFATRPAESQLKSANDVLASLSIHQG